MAITTDSTPLRMPHDAGELSAELAATAVKSEKSNVRLASFTIADAEYFRNFLHDVLPTRIFDCHVHTCEPDAMGRPPQSMQEYPACLAWRHAIGIDAYDEIAKQLFPGKTWDGLFFGMPFAFGNIEQINERLQRQADDAGRRRLFIVRPDTSLSVLESQVRSPSFAGLKPYPELAPGGAVGIADMLSEEQLAFAHELGLIVMLHLPGPWNVVNVQHIRELKRIVNLYPNARVVLAHCALASCPAVARKLMAALAGSGLYFDTSGTTQPGTFEAILEHFGPERLLFGTDHPVGLMKAKLSCQDNTRAWAITHPNPFVSQGSSSNESSYAVYEMIRALSLALTARGLGRDAMQQIMSDNAVQLLTTH